MTKLRTALSDRREEFEVHFSVVVALEDRIFSGEEISLGATHLSVRHILNMKSGLIVHLYIIVEATMSGTIELIGEAVGTVPPRHWSVHTLKEWLREYAVVRVDGNEETRLTTVHGVSLSLLGDIPLGPHQFKKPTGTWTDKHIAIFASRLGVEFRLPEDIWRRIAPKSELRDMGPLEFLADRRNALAHGRQSFEQGARDLTQAKIRELADITLDYLELTASAFQEYVDRSQYMAPLQSIT